MVLCGAGCGEKYMKALLEVPTPLGYEKTCDNSLSYDFRDDLIPYKSKKYELTY